MACCACLLWVPACSACTEESTCSHVFPKPNIQAAARIVARCLTAALGGASAIPSDHEHRRTARRATIGLAKRTCLDISAPHSRGVCCRSAGARWNRKRTRTPSLAASAFAMVICGRLLACCTRHHDPTCRSRSKWRLKLFTSSPQRTCWRRAPATPQPAVSHQPSLHRRTRVHRRFAGAA